MSAQSAMLRGRHAAEQLMVDECRITRAGSGRGPWNAATRDYDPAPPVTVYSGRCQVKVVDAQVNDTVAGEAAIGVGRAVVKLPVLESTGVRADDDVELVRVSFDPDLKGRHFTVTAPDHQTFATARRLPCVEVV